MSKRGGGSNPNFSFSGRHLALLGAAAEAGVRRIGKTGCDGTTSATLVTALRSEGRATPVPRLPGAVGGRACRPLQVDKAGGGRATFYAVFGGLDFREGATARLTVPSSPPTIAGRQAAGEVI